MGGHGRPRRSFERWHARFPARSRPTSISPERWPRAGRSQRHDLAERVKRRAGCQRQHRGGLVGVDTRRDRTTGHTRELVAILPEFMDMAVSEVKAGGLAWMLSALGFPDYPAELNGYWTVIGTGNAVVGWDPQLKAEATTQGAA